MEKHELWCLVLVALCAFVHSSRIEDEWILQKTGSAGFNHMVMDKNNNKLYVTAVNKLYVFNNSLESPFEVQTGPREDSVNCPPKVRPCNLDLGLTPVYSKGLAIDYTNNRLIVCTNLYQGTCEKHYLDGILYKEEGDSRFVQVVGNSPKASTVLFIAPGPLKGDAGRQLEALYVGAERSKSGPTVFNDMVPSFTSRKLADFDFVYKDLGARSSIIIDLQYRDDFPVHYKYGFGSDGFSYMVVVQKERPSADNFISKIFRVCQNDKKFISYAEMQLECEHDGDVYNLVQAAYVGKPGSSLAQKLGVATTEDVLYAVFSQGGAVSAEPMAESAICVYPMKYVRLVFTENIQNCFQGNGHTGPAHIVVPTPCQKTELKVDDAYCGEHDVNYPIDGVIPVTATAAAVFDYAASSITVLNEEHYTVAFVGTANGHLLKVLLLSQSEGVVYDDTTIDDGTKVKADMFFDNNKEYLYALTDFKLMKVKVKDWRKHGTCAECGDAEDDAYCKLCSSSETTDKPSGTTRPSPVPAHALLMAALVWIFR